MGVRIGVLVSVLVALGGDVLPAAQRKALHAEYRLWLPSGGNAAGASAVLEWAGGGTSADISDRWGRVTFSVPTSVSSGLLSARLDGYCLLPTAVPVSKTRPGHEPELTLSVCY